jgi:hypothetical protein
MCIGINMADTTKFIQGFYNRMVGFKVSTEENLVREKEKKKKVLLYYKNTRISHWLYDIKQISIWTPLVALQISSLYSVPSHTQESVYAMTVSIATQILSLRCCRSIIFRCTQCF